MKLPPFGQFTSVVDMVAASLLVGLETDGLLVPGSTMVGQSAGKSSCGNKLDLAYRGVLL